VGVDVGVDVGVSVTVAVGVGVAVGVTVALGVGEGGTNESSTPVTSATVTRPSPLTSAPGQSAGAPKMTAITLPISAAFTCWSQFASPGNPVDGCAAVTLTLKPISRRTTPTLFNC
jgi:hypothetical protein